MVKIEQCHTQEKWDNSVLDKDGHPLQLWGWGEVKKAHNWQVTRVIIYENSDIIGMAQILLRPLPFPFRYMAYIPRGPVATEKHREVVLKEITQYVKKTFKAVVVTIEPDWTTMPTVKGWQHSPNTILIPKTLYIDLEQSEDKILEAMHSKTRWSIRRSERNGVKIRQVKTRDELKQCLELYKQTAGRAGFGLHDDQYYYDVFDKLGDFSPIFMAFFEDRLIAFSWDIISESVAFALYAGSTQEGQKLRANYLLKWHEMQMLKKWGVKSFDFNGLLNDGISDFKRSFAQHDNQLAGTYDYPLSPLYSVWSRGLPLAKVILRKIKSLR